MTASSLPGPLFRSVPFDVMPIARAGNAPQIEAARKVRRRATGQARRILRTLAAAGPQTREEICLAVHLPQHIACARLAELECPGGRRRPAMLDDPPLIRKAGRRPARSGVHCWVYEITDDGRAVL